MGNQGIVVDEDAPDLPADLTASSWLVADLVTGEVLAANQKAVAQFQATLIQKDDES